jgi:peptide deformylase
MAIIRILQYPDPRLTLKATPVKEFTPELKQMIDDMFETHYAAENCAALAHSQLDFPEPKRITVIDFSEEKNEPLCLVNPEITEKSGETHTEEGCMSVATGVVAKVKRAEKIHVKFLDRDGKPQELDADGFLAKCIQHEIDHLDGVLFIDRISDFKRRQLDKKIQRHQKRL